MGEVEEGYKAFVQSGQCGSFGKLNGSMGMVEGESVQTEEGGAVPREQCQLPCMAFQMHLSFWHFFLWFMF